MNQPPSLTLSSEEHRIIQLQHSSHSLSAYLIQFFHLLVLFRIFDGGVVVDENMGSIKLPIDAKSKGKGDDVKAHGKRMRENYRVMLHWVLKVAKDPHQCNQRCYTSEEQPWKKVLLARHAMFSTKPTSEQQKRQNMHPSMYSDDECGRKQVPIGTAFQADLPEFSCKSDSRWLGTKIWPLPNSAFQTNLGEIGKGRQEPCSCQFPASPKCIKFHIQEKTSKLKVELGVAFYRWKFDGMGEDAALSWTKLDEIMFQVIVKSNRVSSEKYFWDQLFKYFPNKGRETLVSYYFNVFLLRRRSHQNRSVVMDIDSDDEESEFGPVADRFGQTGSKKH